MSLGGLDALFNPAKRHMDDEKLRLQSTREEVGDASGGKRIDLDSGKVRIRKPAVGKPPTETAVASAAPDGDRAVDASTDDDGGTAVPAGDTAE